MPRLNPLPYREVKRKLEAAGFIALNQERSHIKFARRTETELRVAIVPRHREVVTGTLRAILRQADLTVEEFERLGAESNR